MKIPTTRLTFEDLGYDPGYYVVMPRSVTVGFIDDTAPHVGETLEQRRKRGRQSNVNLLAMATEWSLEGENGNRLPLIKDVHGDPVPSSAKLADLIAEARARGYAGDVEHAKADDLRAFIQEDRDYVARAAVLREVPMDILQRIANRVLNPKIDEATEGF